MKQVMETRRKARSAGWVVGLFILFLLSCVNSCNEIQYALTSRTAEAQITKRLTPLVDGERLIRAVEYTFETEEGKTYEGRLKVNPDTWVEPAEGKFQIAYLPYKPRISRPAEDQDLRSIVIFLLFAAAFAGYCAHSYRMAKEGRID